VFSKIMAPVDLAHLDKLEKALRCTADLARHYKARVIYVAVTSALPGKIAHTPEEFGRKLDAFAAEQGEAHGIATSSHPMLSHDPTTDLDQALLMAVTETGADLVVMQSHIPNVADYIWPSNGGDIAAHAKISVFVVRD